MKVFTKLRPFVTAALATLLLAGAHAQTKVPVRMTVQGTMTTQLIQTAIDQGFFAEQNIDPRPVSVTNGPAAATALASGSVDLATNAPEVFLALAGKGQGIQLISGAGRQSSALLFRKGVDLPGEFPQSVQALRGKKIGVTVLSSATQHLVTMILSSAGVAASEVQFVAVGGAAPQALANAIVDAAILTDAQIPFGLQLGATIMMDMRDAQRCPKDVAALKICGAPWIGTWATTDWVRKNPAILESVRKALAKADVFLKDTRNDAQVAAALGKRLPPGLSEQEKSAFVEQGRKSLTAVFSADDLQTWIDIDLKAGVISQAMPVASVYAAGTAGSQRDVKALAGVTQ